MCIYEYKQFTTALRTWTTTTKCNYTVKQPTYFQPRYSHAKAQGSRDVGLPVRAVKHERPSKTTKEHPVRVGSQLHSNTSSQNHKDCRRKSVTWSKGKVWMRVKSLTRNKSNKRTRRGSSVKESWCGLSHRHEINTSILKIQTRKWVFKVLAVLRSPQYWGFLGSLLFYWTEWD